MLKRLKGLAEVTLLAVWHNGIFRAVNAGVGPFSAKAALIVDSVLIPMRTSGVL